MLLSPPVIIRFSGPTLEHDAMSTTPEIQQNLVAEAELFSTVFDDEAGKKWFVKKIVAHHAAAADVEAASRQSLLKQWLRGAAKALEQHAKEQGITVEELMRRSHQRT
jgi:hypothetical protein